MKANLQQLVEIGSGKYIGYNQDAKNNFHYLARHVARQIAKKLGLEKGSYDIRTNMGGIAVCGETTLHGENIYIQISQSCLGPNMGFMYRSCQGRLDYTGGPNQWMKWDELANLDAACRKFESVMYEAKDFSHR